LENGAKVEMRGDDEVSVMQMIPCDTEPLSEDSIEKMKILLHYIEQHKIKTISNGSEEVESSSNEKEEQLAKEKADDEIIHDHLIAAEKAKELINNALQSAYQVRAGSNEGFDAELLTEKVYQYYLQGTYTFWGSSSRSVAASLELAQ